MANTNICDKVTKIKQWYRLVNMKWAYNHFEEGWSDFSIPTAKFDKQKRAWKGHTWKFEYGYLINNKVFDSMIN